MQRLRRLDLFCRVVDNFGDAGVALRLARQLVIEHDVGVRLFIDDLVVLSRMLPGVRSDVAVQHCDGIEVRLLDDDVRPERADDVPDAVVEAFGCGLPGRYVDAIECASKPPPWIVLEYLTAEPWADAVHGLPSPPPRRALARWFFCPGFTPATGGLLRERGLFAQRDAVANDAARRRQLFASLGLQRLRDGAFVVSLFCYPNAALPALFDAWRTGDEPLACIVPDGVATAALAATFGSDAPRAGEARTRDALSVAVASFVDQQAFDGRLWCSDVVVARGEDSFVRAQWAAKPFAWHAYPQADDAHVAKIDAFLDRYRTGLDATTASTLGEFWRAFNRADAGSIGPAWQRFVARRQALAAHAVRWADELALQADLATQLVDFTENRL